MEELAPKIGGCMHPFSNIDGCSCTRYTRSYEGPACTAKFFCFCTYVHCKVSLLEFRGHKLQNWKLQPIQDLNWQIELKTSLCTAFNVFAIHFRFLTNFMLKTDVLQSIRRNSLLFQRNCRIRLASRLEQILHETMSF